MEGIGEKHLDVIVSYLRQMRFKRAQHVHDVAACFGELIESRVMDDEVFSGADVQDMLEGLCAVVKGDVESELINNAHANVVVLRQMIQQAEKWKLHFQLDMAALEDRKELEAIAKFEEQQFSIHSKSSKLQPINDGAGTALMASELEKLQQDNKMLRERCDDSDRKLVQALKQRDEEKALREAAERRVAVLESTRTEATPPQPAAAASQADEGDTAELKAALAAAEAALSEAQRDLAAKLSETPQFVNMRKMLETKNAQIKQLRSELENK